MSTKPLPQLVRLQSIDSTNEEAFRLHAAGEAAPFFVTAAEQTQGRGRTGRTWHSPKGNLYLSCLLENPAPPSNFSQLGFVAGVALIDALVATAHSKCFHLKWPNDVIVDGAKLAGLLLETRQQKNAQAIVIGWGVNISETPKDLPYRAIGLHEILSSLDIEQLRQQLMQAFMLRLSQWRRGENFAAIRELWLQFALPPGTPLMVRGSAQEKYEGVFDGIDADGSLLLKTPIETKRIIAGDVILPGAA
jgi:BirA family biotin operon repressor/biotin-[acetyl-CoA-carboxylase] ligase